MPETYGQYQVKRALDQGGQGAVFLVEDMENPKNEYALKRLQEDSQLERFEIEMKVLQKLDHPNIVSIEDSDLEGSEPYIVMEYCKGGNLADSPERWSEKPEHTLKLFTTVVEAVKAAHDAGVVHRDIKPANVLLRGPDTPVVADFGICYWEDGDRQTLSNEQVGARHYIAPELERGRVEEVKPRSDIYSLGKLLYWMLSGGRIFPRETHREDDDNLVQVTGNPSLEQVNRLLDLMITLQPEDRYSSLDSVIEALNTVQRAVAGEYRVIKRGHQPQCLFCGVGAYQWQVKPEERAASTRNFGIQPVGAANWAILVCDACGHVQLFRTDMARYDEWWEKGD